VEETANNQYAFRGMANVESPDLYGCGIVGMTAEEVAKRLGVSTATIRREIARGKLDAFRVGRNVRITNEALLKYVGGN